MEDEVTTRCLSDPVVLQKNGSYTPVNYKLDKDWEDEEKQPEVPLFQSLIKIMEPPSQGNVKAIISKRKRPRAKTTTKKIGIKNNPNIDVPLEPSTPEDRKNLEQR